MRRFREWYLNREPVWLYVLRYALRNAVRRIRWLGRDLDMCEGCGLLWPSETCRAFATSDGNEHRHCRSCSAFQRWVEQCMQAGVR